MDVWMAAQHGEKRLIIAIDPGPEYSAYCEYDPVEKRPIKFAKVDNGEMRIYLRMLPSPRPEEDRLIIEMIASYGMPAGREIFATCVFIGRLIELYGAYLQTHLVEREEVKLHLCRTKRAKDSNIIQVLRDRFGDGSKTGKGTKKKPGILYGIKDDCWQALALAVTWADTHHK